ncbi:hypothetical protein YC2023_069461 [Brassica napus]
MTSWKKTIATPFKKAATFFNQPQQTPHNRHANAQAREEHERRTVKELQSDVMACGYEDVLVMWSILDKSSQWFMNYDEVIPSKVHRQEVKEIAYNVGDAIAKSFLEKGITKVAFDRGGYPYHKRIEALAAAAREHGLHF